MKHGWCCNSLQVDNPGCPLPVSVLGKKAGEQWKIMSAADKAPYEAKSTASKAEYARLKMLTAEQRALLAGASLQVMQHQGAQLYLCIMFKAYYGCNGVPAALGCPCDMCYMFGCRLGQTQVQGNTVLNNTLLSHPQVPPHPQAYPAHEEELRKLKAQLGMAAYNQAAAAALATLLGLPAAAVQTFKGQGLSLQHVPQGTSVSQASMTSTLQQQQPASADRLLEVLDGKSSSVSSSSNHQSKVPMSSNFDGHVLHPMPQHASRMPGSLQQQSQPQLAANAPNTTTSLMATMAAAASSLGKGQAWSMPPVSPSALTTAEVLSAQQQQLHQLLLQQGHANSHSSLNIEQQPQLQQAQLQQLSSGGSRAESAPLPVTLQVQALCYMWQQQQLQQQQQQQLQLPSTAAASLPHIQYLHDLLQRHQQQQLPLPSALAPLLPHVLQGMPTSGILRSSPAIPSMLAASMSSTLHPTTVANQSGMPTQLIAPPFATCSGIIDPAIQPPATGHLHQLGISTQAHAPVGISQPHLQQQQHCQDMDSSCAGFLTMPPSTTPVLAGVDALTAYKLQGRPPAHAGHHAVQDSTTVLPPVELAMRDAFLTVLQSGGTMATRTPRPPQHSASSSDNATSDNDSAETDSEDDSRGGMQQADDMQLLEGTAAAGHASSPMCVSGIPRPTPLHHQHAPTPLWLQQQYAGFAGLSAAAAADFAQFMGPVAMAATNTGA